MPGSRLSLSRLESWFSYLPTEELGLDTKSLFCLSFLARSHGKWQSPVPRAVRIQLGRAGEALIKAHRDARLLDVNNSFDYSVATKSGHIDIILPRIVM